MEKNRNIIRLTFFNSDFQITICKGQVCIPELKDRLRITCECHTSSVADMTNIFERI